jgi:hypothetical protein
MRKILGPKRGGVKEEGGNCVRSFTVWTVRQILLG